MPWTESFCDGDVVPIPTLPPVVAKYAEPDDVRAVVDAYVAVTFPAETFDAKRFVDVAFVVVPFVTVEFVIVAFVANRSVKFASADVSESITPVVKCPTDEKNDVVVALVPVAFPNDRFEIKPFVIVPLVAVTFVANEFVDVALVVVELTAVKFPRVVDADERFVTVPVVIVPFVELKFVAVMFVELRLVVVAEVPVALVNVSPWSAVVPVAVILPAVRFETTPLVVVEFVAVKAPTDMLFAMIDEIFAKVDVNVSITPVVK